MKKLLKPKKCVTCKTEFNPHSSLAKTCSPKCAVEYTKQVRAKKQAKSDKARLEEMKTLPQLIKECQQVFNKFIRLRDWGKPCISCGAPHTGAANSFDAGHYRSVGSSPEVRFDPRNVSGQCKQCNRYTFDSAAYRAELVRRIGLDEVEALEADRAPKHYTKEQVRALMVHYKQRCKELERERN